jgi:hypothetical protein
MIGAILKELIGLFVDDELLAPGWLVGLMLALGLPAALAASVFRSAHRATPRE